MARTDAHRDLSRLELAVLGLLSTGGPCTAYWVRRQFQVSPSSFFSGSAGAVYPVMRRLESRMLVECDEVSEGRRRSRLYRLTKAGERELRTWLLPPVPLEDVAFTMDPIRTRVYYLEVLAPEERRRLLDDAIDQTRNHIAVVKADARSRRASGDRFSYLGARGVELEMQARVKWLEEVRRALDDDS